MESMNFDETFYKMCIEDNQIIFEITSRQGINLPLMSLLDLKNILFKKLKLNKACDINMLTVEHLRFCGDKTLTFLCSMLNKIIENIQCLSSPQLNISIASIVHKGKNKSKYDHRSYRLVRVTSLIGRIIDEYMRPNLIEINRKNQNINQYGFTTGMSYLLAALQRHESEMFCLDNHRTFFTVSLDGVSAFDVHAKVQIIIKYISIQPLIYLKMLHWGFKLVP